MPAGGREILIRVDDSLPGWWPRYFSTLAKNGFGEEARHVIGADADYILKRGILGGDPIPEDPVVRTGLVMGAVQSGKTASMLAVIAKALDAGIQIIVVLAGTQVSLWKQTYDRILRELDPLSIGDDAGDRVGLFRPRPEGTGSNGARRFDLKDLYRIEGAAVRKCLRQSQSLVFVTMKEGNHLVALQRVLHDAVYPHLDAVPGKRARILVLDDESDDGSVIDAETEQSLDPTIAILKQIPRHVADLWSIRGSSGATASPRLDAIYVGYTATPQANFLQAGSNPLAPRDFVAALRVPWMTGALTPRATTYLEPAGLTRFYTGAEVFYESDPLPHAPDGPFVITNPDLQSEQGGSDSRAAWVTNAIRSYVVAGAIRLKWSTRRYSNLDGASFRTETEAAEASPEVHTMLFHPSSAIDNQFASAAEILEWSRRLDPDEARRAIQRGDRTIDGEGIRRDLDENEESWISWLERFAESSQWLRESFGPGHAQYVHDPSDWEELRELIVSEVLPRVRLSIINSDPTADARPVFRPVQVAQERWSPAPDLLTIFVSGSVMSRGLTLEGLCTTLFLRTSGLQVADTKMQMQRWFGYRGKHLGLCRLFTESHQLRIFREFHEDDEALRRQVINAMNEAADRAPSPLVLEGLDWRATGKIAGTTRIPLSPGSWPFVTMVNTQSQPDPNIEVVSRAFTARHSDVVSHGLTRGVILEKPLSLIEAAELLEKLRYEGYVPSRDDLIYSRWAALSLQLGLGVPTTPLLRVPSNQDLGEGTPIRTLRPSECPYSIAAYLRTWEACLSRRVPGLVATDNMAAWSSLDLAERRRRQPKFWVGIRYGSGSNFNLHSGISAKASDKLRIPLMKRKLIGDQVDATWGSRGLGDGESAYLGDQLFDYHYHKTDVGEIRVLEGKRPFGADGQILFHLIEIEGKTPVVSVGVCIPLGGPDHVAVKPVPS